MTVSRPSVVPGLFLLQNRFGRLAWVDVLAPAIALAREGFVVGPDLARMVKKAVAPETRLSPGFEKLFRPGGRPVEVGDRLVQPALGATLAAIARDGAKALIAGPIVDRLAAAVRADGGALAPGDFADHEVSVEPANAIRFARATIHGPRPETTGFGVLAPALAKAGTDGWPGTRDAAYVARVAAALRAAWTERALGTRPLSAAAVASAQHTTHLCAADGAGGLVSLTFTHGPLWFGSGLLEEETGILLNCGASLLVRDAKTSVRFAQAYISPVIVRADDGTRYALGTPGGRRIPATMMTALIDVLAGGASLAEGLARPRIATAPDGSLEVEAGLKSLAPDAKIISPGGFFGPASGIARFRDGTLAGARDPRFHGAIADVDAAGATVLN